MGAWLSGFGGAQTQKPDGMRTRTKTNRYQGALTRGHSFVDKDPGPGTKDLSPGTQGERPTSLDPQILNF